MFTPLRRLRWCVTPSFAFATTHLPRRRMSGLSPVRSPFFSFFPVPVVLARAGAGGLFAQLTPSWHHCPLRCIL